MIVLLCGLSGVGKTTLATKTAIHLKKNGFATEIIDGDEYRKTVCKDLGFSKADRFENIRRLGSIAHSFSTKGIISIVSAINPYEEIRTELKAMYKNVKVVHLDCSLDLLFTRDTKGLYKRASLPNGHHEKIDNLTGINDQFESPVAPDLYINTGIHDIDESAGILFSYLIRELTISTDDIMIHDIQSNPLRKVS